jgi:hypothetical protein
MVGPLSHRRALPRLVAWTTTANNRGDSSAGEGFDEGIGVVGLVANQCLRIGVLQQRLCADEKGAFLKTKEPARLGRQQQ